MCNANEYTDFDQLNEIGIKAEKAFYQFMIDRGYTNIDHIDKVYEQENIKRNEWDFRGTCKSGETITFEVKAAYDCHRYGQFTVEQIQNGKPGGIAVSTADYFVMVNDIKGFGIVETARLKKTHHYLQKIATPGQYALKKSIGGVTLWKTVALNPASGWRQKNDTINWIN